MLLESQKIQAERVVEGTKAVIQARRHGQQKGPPERDQLVYTSSRAGKRPTSGSKMESSRGYASQFPSWRSSPKGRTQEAASYSRPTNQSSRPSKSLILLPMVLGTAQNQVPPLSYTSPANLVRSSPKATPPTTCQQHRSWKTPAAGSISPVWQCKGS